MGRAKQIPKTYFNLKEALRGYLFYQFSAELFSQRARVGEVSSGLPIVAIGEFSLVLFVLSLLQQAQKIESGYNDSLKSGLPSYEETRKLIDTLFIVTIMSTFSRILIGRLQVW